MKMLSETWFTDGYIDFELKKYTILAYLQEISKYFGENKLYPQLADVIFHYNNLIAFRDNKKYLQEQFPKKLSIIQMEQLQMLYQQMIEDDDLMVELEEIINYATAEIKTTIANGTEIYEFVETHLDIFPIGIVPLENNEGYFFLSNGKIRTTSVYQYSLSFFHNQDEKFRSIKTEFVDNWTRSIATTYENIKADLLKRKKDMPNPAVFCIETALSFPVNETLLPVAKRSLVRYISKP